MTAIGSISILLMSALIKYLSFHCHIHINYGINSIAVCCGKFRILFILHNEIANSDVEHILQFLKRDTGGYLTEDQYLDV